MDKFIIIGPQCISGPWSASDYTLALGFVADVHKERGGNPLKLGDWLLVWQEG